jgi:hypothetical protein
MTELPIPESWEDFWESRISRESGIHPEDSFKVLTNEIIDLIMDELAVIDILRVRLASRRVATMKLDNHFFKSRLPMETTRTHGLSTLTRTAYMMESLAAASRSSTSLLHVQS